SRIISISELPWEDRQPGVKRKLLWQDEATRRQALLTRIEPGAALPRHRHVGDELIFVLEGAIGDDFGLVTAGHMGYRPDGCVHPIAPGQGAAVLAIRPGDGEPAAERGGAPPSQVFALHDLPWLDTRPGVRQKRIWEDKAGERRAILARFEPGATLP